MAKVLFDNELLRLLTDIYQAAATRFDKAVKTAMIEAADIVARNFGIKHGDPTGRGTSGPQPAL